MTRKTTSSSLEIFLQKYRSAVVLVVLFILSNIAIYAFNNHLSVLIAENTETANIATEQGIEVQQITKSLINIESNLNKFERGTLTVAALSQEIQQSLYELKLSAAHYNSVLLAFDKGGTVSANSGMRMKVTAISSKAGRKSVQRTLSIWRPYKRLIDNFIQSVDNGSMSKASAEYAADYARLFSQDLFEEANALAYLLHQQTQAKVTLMKNALIPNAVITTLLFLLVVYKSLRRCMRTAKDLDEARKETNEILETIKEGILVVDDQLVIRKYSATLNHILAGHQFADLPLNTLLRAIVPEKEIGITETFTEQLFKSETNEGMLDHINPLKKVLITVEDKNGDAHPHHFTFAFSRIYEDETIQRVLVSIRDITQAVALDTHKISERKKRQATAPACSNPSEGCEDCADSPS